MIDAEKDVPEHNALKSSVWGAFNDDTAPASRVATSPFSAAFASDALDVADEAGLEAMTDDAICKRPDSELADAIAPLGLQTVIDAAVSTFDAAPTTAPIATGSRDEEALSAEMIFTLVHAMPSAP